MESAFMFEVIFEKKNEGLQYKDIEMLLNFKPSLYYSNWRVSLFLDFTSLALQL